MWMNSHSVAPQAAAGHTWFLCVLRRPAVADSLHTDEV